MKKLVKKIKKKEMRNFVILKTKELVKIKGGQSIPIEIEID
ncbi:MAG: ComC/BlpC family leader-containing pheromone/bacteriocin [Bacteroidales bacterium]|nr:ComC/BlpC family leader-containing pheromone/bacteriocin [Bacteroidales bacterium]